MVFRIQLHGGMNRIVALHAIVDTGRSHADA
jgi:hypothetical protein